MAWPVRGGAEESARRNNSVAAARVVGVMLRGEDGGERVAGAKYRRGPRISAGRSGIRIPANSPVISAAALRCREKGKGRGAADVRACGSVTELERAGRGARTRAPCCCVGRLRRLGRARAAKRARALAGGPGVTR